MNQIETSARNKAMQLGQLASTSGESSIYAEMLIT